VNAIEGLQEEHLREFVLRETNGFTISLLMTALRRQDDGNFISCSNMCVGKVFQTFIRTCV